MTHRLTVPRDHALLRQGALTRLARCVLIAQALMVQLLVALLPTTSHAQRPAPPKGWAIDTTGDRPVASRKGGMMSSDSRADVLGPMAWSGVSVADWLRTFGHDNAGALGALIPPTANPVSEVTIAGRRVVVAAYSVKAAASTLYFSYSMSAESAPGTPAVVIRSSFTDALTMVRAFRTSVEALLPYVISPTPQMRALAVAAAPATVPTSFRTPPPAQDASATATPASDTSLANAVNAGMADAITLLGSDSTAAASPSGAQTSPTRQTTTRPPVRATPPRATAISEANVELVVFYQWGDLQYHPVALFRDGTAFDLDDDAIDAIDVAGSKTAFPGKWGRWRRAGQKYFLRDGTNGRESDWTLGSGFHPAFPSQSSGTLNGRYKSVSGSTMGETSTLLTSTLRFLPDGRFTSGTDFAAVGSGEVSGVTMAGGSSRSTSGRYRMSGYHIELIYDSGQKKSYFFGFGSSGAPPTVDRDLIFIGDTAYVLETP
jgi:hypothetical protein